MDWKSGVMDEIDPLLVTAAVEAMTDTPDAGLLGRGDSIFLQFQLEYLGGKKSHHPDPNM